MKLLSVVIPSYDMARHLELTLDSLQALQRPDGVALEVVVVDDGSTDGTRQVVSRAQERLPELRYVHRPRDESSGRATARNLGATLANGDCLLFIDAGVLVPPDLLTLSRPHFVDSRRVVLSFPVLGLLVDGSAEEMQLLGGYAGDVRELANKVACRSTWTDPRSPWFDACDGELSRLAAPWTLCWTCALLLTRRLFDEVGRFDESFRGWGSEDIDLGRRLQAVSAEFRVERRTALVHVPHRSSGAPEQRAHSNRRNRAKIHQKSPDVASELMTVLSAIHSNLLLHRLQLTPLDYFTALPAEGIARAVAATEGAKLGVLGFTDIPALASLRPSHVFAHNATAQRVLSRALPAARVLSSLGIATELRSEELDAVIVSDFMRTLPAAVRRAQIAELTRIARVVLVLSTDDECILRKQRTWHGEERLDSLWPWLGREEALTEWELAGHRLERGSRGDATELVRVHPFARRDREEPRQLETFHA